MRTRQPILGVFLLTMICGCSLAGQSAVVGLPGDIDGNGVVNSLDIEMLKEFIAEIIIAPQVPALANADLDGDGRVLAVDGVVLDSRLPHHAGDLYETDAIVGDLLFVPSGSFIQGSPPTEPCRERWDQGSETQFAHTLTQNIAVMPTEVSRQMWTDLKLVQPTLPNDPSNTQYSAGPAHPVQNCTWYEAMLFANLLSAQRGLAPCYFRDPAFTQPVTADNYNLAWGNYYWQPDADGFRLLSEGEWERCCRAGTETPFFVGENRYDGTSCTSCTPGALPNLEPVMVFCVNDSLSAQGVASKIANPWGLYDTHGNVWEWCWDWYLKTYPSVSAVDYAGPAVSATRSARGGSFGLPARDCRSAQRYNITPGNRSLNVGFRLARTVP